MPALEQTAWTLLDWMQFLANVATVLGILVVWQVVRALRQDRVSAWAATHVVYMAASVDKNKGIVFAHYDVGDHFDQWSDADKKAGFELCATMEEVCHYRESLGNKRFWRIFGHPVAKAFKLLEPAIHHARKKDHREKGKWPKWWNFARTGAEALKMRDFSEVNEFYGHKSRKS